MFDVIPEAHRGAARSAMGQVVAGGAIERVAPLLGGASGALAYRVDTRDRSFVLRVETGRDIFRNPDRTYPCLVAAAEAGIAPAVHVADAAAGILVLDHIDHRPVAEHPGGAAAVAVEVAGLVRRLQATPPFPPMLDDFGELLAQMLGFVRSTDLFRSGGLDPHAEGLETIRAAYPWDRWPQVSGHNDLNPFNLLFDGDRIWIVDWELAFRNDAFADAAGLANGLELAETAIAPMLEALLGAPSDRLALARFDVHCHLNRLFYACLLVSALMGAVHGADPTGRTPAELRRDLENGTLRAGTPEIMLALATSQLRAFLDGLASDHLQESLRVVAND